MIDVVTWFTSLMPDMPSMHWLAYVVAAIVGLIIIDAFLSLLFGAISMIFGKK